MMKSVVFASILAASGMLAVHAADNGDMKEAPAAAAAPAPAADKPMHKEHGHHKRDDKRFAKANKDGDGKLDKEEAKAMPMVAKHFDEIDADKDGTVTREELHDYMKARHHHKRKHKHMEPSAAPAPAPADAAK